MRFLLAISWFSISYAGFGQYPFEQFPVPKSRRFSDWKQYDLMETKGRFHVTIALPLFFDNKDTLTIQLSNYKSSADGVVRLFRNSNLVYMEKEPMFFFHASSENVAAVDVNGDGLTDVKLLVSFAGTGSVASLSYRIIYIIQKPSGKFEKISFSDKVLTNKVDRDFNQDGKLEIVTMELNEVDDHNYWTFNVYNFDRDSLVCVNEKFGYPIMFQYLFKPNYKQASLPDSLVKTFARRLPEDYYKN
jgi:hypothetical protein